MLSSSESASPEHGFRSGARHSPIGNSWQHGEKIFASGAYERPRRALLSYLQLVFPPWTDTGQARETLRLATRIYNYHAPASAPGAVSQVAKGCAAQDWGQLLTLRVKTCSHFRSFTRCGHSRVDG